MQIIPTIEGIEATALTDVLGDLSSFIAAKMPGMHDAAHVVLGELSLTIKAQHIAETLTLLRDDPKCQFEVLIDICGVDYPEREKRFEVVYHLLSPRLNQRIRVKTSTDEATPIASVNDIFPAANWYEREAYDMFGIRFTGTRICAASSPTTASRAIRCARISR